MPPVAVAAAATCRSRSHPPSVPTSVARCCTRSVGSVAAQPRARAFCRGARHTKDEPRGGPTSDASRGLAAATLGLAVIAAADRGRDLAVACTSSVRSEDAPGPQLGADRADRPDRVPRDCSLGASLCSPTGRYDGAASLGAAFVVDGARPVAVFLVLAWHAASRTTSSTTAARRDELTSGDPRRPRQAARGASRRAAAGRGAPGRARRLRRQRVLPAPGGVRDPHPGRGVVAIAQETDTNLTDAEIVAAVNALVLIAVVVGLGVAATGIVSAIQPRSRSPLGPGDRHDRGRVALLFSSARPARLRRGRGRRAPHRDHQRCCGVVLALPPVGQCVLRPVRSSADRLGLAVRTDSSPAPKRRAAEVVRVDQATLPADPASGAAVSTGGRSGSTRLRLALERERRFAAETVDPALGVDEDDLAGLELAEEDLLRQRVLDLALDRATQPVERRAPGRSRARRAAAWPRS